ncbi:hypothetical protein [Pantoea sp. App145]|uniref:hypothetical protein n=1 Tax=Pantoea sp. App145 TaxID=3071567 RepID=UPI003A7FA28B
MNILPLFRLPRQPDWIPVCAQLLLSLSPWLFLPLTRYLTPLWPVSVTVLALAWGLVIREFCYPRRASGFRLQLRVFSLLWLLFFMLLSAYSLWPLRYGVSG